MKTAKSIHANFSVDNLAAAKEFYVDKLGFKPIKEVGTDIVLDAGGGTRVNIYEKADHTPWDSTVMGIEVDDIRQAVDELAGAGVQVEKVPGTDEAGIMSYPGGGNAAWFRDPAGNWICVGDALR